MNKQTMQKSITSAIAALFVLLFLWLSAVPLLSWYEYSSNEHQLDAAVQRWHEDGIEDYSFRFEMSAYFRVPFSDAVQVFVRESEIVDVVNDRTLAKMLDSQYKGIPLTVDQLFQHVRSELASNMKTVDVTYDEEYGFPSKIRVSEGESERDAVVYTVTSFEQL